MALEVAFARRAEEDFIEIAEYLEARNPAAAEKVSRRIEKAIGLLAEHPHMGPLAPSTGQVDMRRISVPPYVVFYRLGATQLEIARILHSSRDLDNADHFVG
jgi:toxin ParE1/3/4